MTGHGEAQLQRQGLTVTIELRTLNSRYFKLTVRAAENFTTLEARMEPVVRRHVRRGTAQVTVWLDRQADPEDYRLNTRLLDSYRQQLQAMPDAGSIPLGQLLLLPGVVEQAAGGPQRIEREWPVICEALEAAAENLTRMRRREGEVMQRDLEANCQAILGQLDEVAARAPSVVAAYRDRLTERLSNLLSEVGSRLEPADVVREVGIFAERSDISEELVRLRSHVQQFQGLMQGNSSGGRKLDFLTQEMFREANTIGAKANSADISGHVVEIKATIERMREMVQNIE
jgi:uncharacterized protein (TIGR00255 family)